MIFDHKHLEIHYSSVPQKNVKLAVNFFKADNYGNQFEFLDKKLVDLKIPEDSTLDKIQTTKLEIDTQKMGNEFEILITKSGQTILDIKRDAIGRFWPGRTEFTNPIYSVFDKYVPHYILEKMLFEFESPESDLKDPSKVFERGVSWLLNLIGFPTILLGGYEKIKDGADSISTDILTSRNDDILLVNTTIGLPKQSDFDRERDYRDSMNKLVNNTELKIKSVYFTARDATESQKSAQDNDVVLIGKEKLKLILDYLKNGDINQTKEVIDQQSF